MNKYTITIITICIKNFNFYFLSVVTCHKISNNIKTKKSQKIKINEKMKNKPTIQIKDDYKNYTLIMDITLESIEFGTLGKNLDNYKYYNCCVIENECVTMKSILLDAQVSTLRELNELVSNKNYYNENINNLQIKILKQGCYFVLNINGITLMLSSCLSTQYEKILTNGYEKSEIKERRMCYNMIKFSKPIILENGVEIVKIDIQNKFYFKAKIDVMANQLSEIFKFIDFMIYQKEPGDCKMVKRAVHLI